MARDEFPKPVREALAKRASYICSNPDCHALTIAPSDVDASNVLYIGMASHICAASEGGPRFDASTTTEERKGIENGIFLCSSCADMIDRNNGADFSPQQLRTWKTQHDEWVRANLNKRPDSALSVIAGTHEATGVGKVTGLDIQGPALIKPGTVSKATGAGEVTGTRIGRPREE